MNDLAKLVETVASAYEIERGCWDWWVEAPPHHCDASYFRLRRFIRLAAPRFIIEKEIELLWHKLALMQRMRLGVSVH
jgi:hypothetical protein